MPSTKVTDLAVRKEFTLLLPPLTPKERSALEESIKREGCREPIVYWRGWIVDGHNRYEICKANNIPFKTVELKVSTVEAVKAWIDRNQLGRRNLTPDQFKLVLGRYQKRRKRHKGAPEDNKNASKQRGQVEPVVSGRTAEKVAEEFGVSPSTVKRATKLAELAEKHPELEQAIREGKPAAPIVKAITAQEQTTLPVKSRASEARSDQQSGRGGEGVQGQVHKVRVMCSSLECDMNEDGYCNADEIIIHEVGSCTTRNVR